MSDHDAATPRSPSTVEQRADMVVLIDDRKYIESLEKRQKLAKLCEDLKTEWYSMDATLKQSLVLDETIFDEFKENCDRFSASKRELQLALGECNNETCLGLDSGREKDICLAKPFTVQGQLEY